jgi:hypothetical protein
MLYEQSHESHAPLSDTSLPGKYKKQKTAPKDVSEVRRSNRIAVITAGYKDKEAAMQAAAKVEDSTKIKEKQAAKTVSKKKHTSKNSCKKLLAKV